jgi:protein-tyrosine phosphatase
MTSAPLGGKGDRGVVIQSPAVLFVCTGNICRSPMAAAVFRAFAEQAGLPNGLVIDSAGTHDYQLGEPPDPRALAAARRRGYHFPVRRARLVGAQDFTRFGWILAMDRANLDVLETLRPSDYRGNVGLFLDYAPEIGMRDVPDPYAGGQEDFEYVMDLIERGSARLLGAIRAQVLTPHSLKSPAS